jgi:hypothetical protein
MLERLDMMQNQTQNQQLMKERQIKNMMIALTQSINNFFEEMKRNIEQNNECSAIMASTVEQKSNTVGAGDQPKIENEEKIKKNRQKEPAQL